MNYLAHLYLADATQTSLAGSVLGDSVKGRLQGNYPAAIEVGISLHRRVDSYTDHHSSVRAACAEFDPPYRRYAGILVDIYCDYLLTQQWQYFHSEPLPNFAQQVAGKLWEQWPHPPFTAQSLAGFPQVLLSYGSEGGIQTALERVSRRAVRSNPIAQALPVLQAKHAALEQAFARLFPDLIKFALDEANRLRTGLRQG